jgi:hypothetical protein
MKDVQFGVEGICVIETIAIDQGILTEIEIEK